jgi:hypothetical protein
VHNLGTHGRWAFAELTQIYEIGSQFDAKAKRAFEDMLRPSSMQAQLRREPISMRSARLSFMR